MAYQSTLMRHWHSSNWEQWTVNQKDRPQLVKREDSILPNCLTNYFKPLLTWHLKESRNDNFLSRVLSVCTWAIYVQSSKWLRIRQQVWPSLQIRRRPANRREKAPMFESLKAASLGAEPKHGACLRGKKPSLDVAHVVSVFIGIRELVTSFLGFSPFVSRQKGKEAFPAHEGRSIIPSGAWEQEHQTFRHLRAQTAASAWHTAPHRAQRKSITPPSQKLNRNIWSVQKPSFTSSKIFAHPLCPKLSDGTDGAEPWERWQIADVR